MVNKITRKFNGQNYQYINTYSLENGAKTGSERLKKKGYKVRITKTKGIKGKTKYAYNIYIKKK